MYRVNLIAGDTVVKRFIFDEPPKERDMDELAAEFPDYALDVERIPIDIEEYKRERECDYECE
jgi:hypothetical protein